MGQDKALLPLGDRPLIGQVVTTAFVCTDEVWVMTPWVARYRPILPTKVRFIAEAAVEGDPPGPLVAFAQALNHVQTDWVLLLACDLPNLDGGRLQTWCDQLASLPPEVIAYLPQSSRGWEPLCGFYRGPCRADLEAASALGDRSFQHWLSEQRVVAIPQVPDDMLLNCNTPADWGRYQARANRLQN